MCDWAIRRANDTVFEPSCGEAAFLSAAASRLLNLSSSVPSGRLQGIDIDGPSVTAAREVLSKLGVAAELATGNFFDLAPTHRFDAVVGNPPYVRYQGFGGLDRDKALDAARMQGVQLTRLASSWAAFVIHAASFLSDTGRLALVLPAELMSVNYAAPVRRYLMQRFAHVRLVLFEERVFPGVSEEVVLLMAEGHGPTIHCDLQQTKNIATLQTLVGQRYEPARSDDKWMVGLLPADAASAYSRVSSSNAFVPLQHWGETTLGMVTGNNSFFVLTEERARAHGLSRRDLIQVCPPGSRHLRGLSFGEKAWDDLVVEGAAGYLFAPKFETPSKSAAKYIALGETNLVHQGYKCRNRSPWWQVPRVAVPDAFLTYMNHDTPRIVANRAGLPHLNSVHGVAFRTELREIGTDLLPIAALNTVTLLGAELVGRAYGGGLLKLEPKEADRLPVPSPISLSGCESDLRALRPQLAKSLRKGALLDVVKQVDRVLRKQWNLSGPQVEELRNARDWLFGRREQRGRAKSE